MSNDRLMRQPKVVAFDADDTLWDCQGHFDRVMQWLYDELVPWTDRETSAQELFATERRNMALLGYGTKAFTLSMIETALRVSRHQITADRIEALLRECYSLLALPATPLPEVLTTLQTLQQHDTVMVLFTKGELLDQQHKLERSGLAHFFSHVEITSDKTEREFSDLCHKLGIAPADLLMVGNSLKSDIAPALAIGAQAVHIPFHITWELEHAEGFCHPRLLCITRFSQLLGCLGIP